MNNIQDHTTVYCESLEERKLLIEGLKDAGYDISSDVIGDIDDMRDYIKYPCVTWLGGASRFSVSRGSAVENEKYNVLTVREFREQTGLIYKPQGNSKLIHKFI